MPICRGVSTSCKLYGFREFVILGAVYNQQRRSCLSRSSTGEKRALNNLRIMEGDAAVKKQVHVSVFMSVLENYEFEF